MTRRYLVVYENGPHTMSGFAPDVPGCASTGRTLEEMRVNLRDALEFHLEELAVVGYSIPSAVTHLVEVPEDCLAEWINVELPVAEAVSA